jgi:hypothetical protein
MSLAERSDDAKHCATADSIAAPIQDNQERFLSNSEENTTAEIIAGATLAVIGGTALAIPYFGFLPLGAALAGLAGVAATGRALRLHREANIPPKKGKRSKRKRNS